VRPWTGAPWQSTAAERPPPPCTHSAAGPRCACGTEE